MASAEKGKRDGKALIQVVFEVILSVTPKAGFSNKVPEDGDLPAKAENVLPGHPEPSGSFWTTYVLFLGLAAAITGKG